MKAIINLNGAELTIPLESKTEEEAQKELQGLLADAFREATFRDDPIDWKTLLPQLHNQKLSKKVAN